MRAPVAGLLLTLAVAGAAGCRRDEVAEPAAGVVASCRSGPVTALEVEQRLRGLTAAGEVSGSREALVDAFRRVAEEVVVERALERGAGAATEDPAGLAATREKYRRLAVAEVYALEKVRVDPEVAEAEVRSYYDAHRELFHQPARRTVWHIFRRHQDPAHPEVTVAFVESLRQQLLAGASFAALAREHSHSETRAMGGRLGVVPRGKLPPELEAVVFALAEGEVSAPLSTADGAFLFRATEVVEEQDFELDDVRLRIVRELREERVLAALEEAVAGQPLPPGSRVLDRAGLEQAGRGGDGEVVLEVDGLSWTVAELRQELAEHRQGQPPPLRPEHEVSRLYRRLVLAQLLYLEAAGEGFPELRADAIAAVSRHLSAERLRQQEAERRMAALVDAAPGDVRRFFEDNAFLYQSRLRLHLRSLDAPLGADPGRQVAALEGLRRELEAGRVTLGQAAARVQGRVTDHGWVSSDELAGFDPKVRHYLLAMLGPGYSVVFQLNQRLLLVQVVARDEPRPLDLAQVEGQVRRDYLERSRQELYRRVVSDILEAEQFRFHPREVERRLAGDLAGAR